MIGPKDVLTEPYGHTLYVDVPVEQSEMILRIEPSAAQEPNLSIGPPVDNDLNARLGERIDSQITRAKRRPQQAYLSLFLLLT